MARWVYPVDPDCPEVKEWWDDPAHEATYVSGYIPDPHKIAAAQAEREDFERKHHRTCRRCKEYGIANVDIEY